MRETVERGIPVLAESWVSDSPSALAISQRQTAYWRGNSGSIFCNSPSRRIRSSSSCFMFLARLVP